MRKDFETYKTLVISTAHLTEEYDMDGDVREEFEEFEW